MIGGSENGQPEFQTQGMGEVDLLTMDCFSSSSMRCRLLERLGRDLVFCLAAAMAKGVVGGKRASQCSRCHAATTMHAASRFVPEAEGQAGDKRR